MDTLRFMTYVRKNTNNCWIWQGGTCGKGYGKCGHNYKTVTAHRMSYELFKGPIPSGFIVRHNCDVMLCVNPEHLIVGTYKDNTQDMRDRNRKIGVDAQVPANVIWNIHIAWKAGKTHKQIAEECNLQRGYIASIVAGSSRTDIYKKFVIEHGEHKPRWQGKYSDSDIAKIRELYSKGISTGMLAKTYNTNYKYIWKIVTGRAKKIPLQARGDV